MTNHNYSNSKRVGYDRVEQIREGVSGGHHFEKNCYVCGIILGAGLNSVNPS